MSSFYSPPWRGWERSGTSAAEGLEIIQYKKPYFFAVNCLFENKYKKPFPLRVLSLQGKIYWIRGFPDVEITPSLKDRIKGTDSELEWVLNDAKGLTLIAK